MLLGPNLNEPFEGKGEKKGDVTKLKGDNSIRPFNLASKVNELLMSETVEKNMLTFLSAHF